MHLVQHSTTLGDFTFTYQAAPKALTLWARIVRMVAG